MVGINVPYLQEDVKGMGKEKGRVAKPALSQMLWCFPWGMYPSWVCTVDSQYRNM